jgi:methionine synthase II (cobalamin-independent)
MKKKITKDIEIEDLVKVMPDSVVYLMEKGIRCLRCGEPIWGTLEDAAKEKGFNDKEIVKFVHEINNLVK